MFGSAQKNSGAESFRHLRPIQPAMLRGRAGGVAGRIMRTPYKWQGSRMVQIQFPQVGIETFRNRAGYLRKQYAGREDALRAGKV
jgi:hypothetical protein